MCWNCKIGEYLVYDSDATKTPRCGLCGELEQDNPANKRVALRATTKRTKE